MALSDIINALAADLTGVTVKVGEEFISETNAPPRVIAVPTADLPGGARRHGVGVREPRNILTRIAGCDFHIWAVGAAIDTAPAKDLNATELLLNRVLWFLHQETHGSFTYQSSSWMKAGLDLYGRGVVLSCTFDIPVVPNPAEAGQSVILYPTPATFGNDSQDGALQPQT